MDGLYDMDSDVFPRMYDLLLEKLNEEDFKFTFSVIDKEIKIIRRVK